MRNLLLVLLAGAGLGIWVWAARPVPSQQPDGYLVLAVSWTPSWCAREGDARGDARCAQDAGAGWLVHGLWPQYDAGGWPEFCDSAHAGPSTDMLAVMVDIMGNAGLAGHQWRKHGSCSGLAPAAYFAATRAAFAALEFPDPLQMQAGERRLAPDALIAAFRAANPAFGADSITLTCLDGMVQEFRLCLTHAGIPRPCDAGLQARSCAARQVSLPALR